MARGRAQGAGAGGGGRGWLTLGAGVAPILIVVSLSMFQFANPVVPDISPAQATPRDPTLTVTLLNDVSQAILSLSVGLLVAAAWLGRQPLRRGGPAVTPPLLFAAGALLAVASTYAGLRFRLDLALQLQAVALDLAPLENRLAWQAVTMLLQFCTLSAAATLHHLFRARAADQR